MLLHALDTEAGLSPMGRVSAAGMVTGLLVNRLLLTDLLARHPEIHDVEIARPMVIAGLPRTGTTHLHNLISSDPALRSLPYWESVQPVPFPAEAAAGLHRRRPPPRPHRDEPRAPWTCSCPTSSACTR